MSISLPIHHTSNAPTAAFFATAPFAALVRCKNFICSNPLIQRVSANWKVTLMGISTVLAIAGFVVTFFAGSTFLWMTFATFALTSAIAAFYMRRLEVLTDLESTAKGLKATKEKLEGIANQLSQENNRLSASNRELQGHNETFRINNQTLQQTNVRLTQQVTQMTTQVTQLTLQVTQLRESADRIRTEVSRFQQANTHLHINVGALDQQILNSRALCEQIAIHLTTQQGELNQLATNRQGIGEQLARLERYLADLGADNRVHERIQQLATLQQQTQQTTTQLHQLQLQYATERANFQTIHDALAQLRSQFDLAIHEAAQNNQQLSFNVSALATERQRIHALLNQHFPANTTP